MAVKMLGDMKNDDAVAVPYSYMCQTTDPTAQSKCYEFRYEREIKSAGPQTGLRIIEFTVDNADAEIVEQKVVDGGFDSPARYFKSLASATEVGEIEAMDGKDGGAFAVRSGKTLTNADIDIAKTSVGEIDSKVLFTDQIAKTEATVTAMVTAKKDLDITGVIGGWIKVRGDSGDDTIEYEETAFSMKFMEPASSGGNGGNGGNGGQGGNGGNG